MKAVHVIAAVIGGAVAGAAVGLLLAPAKGQDTRKRICDILKEKGITLKKGKLEQLAEEIEEEVENRL